MTKDQIVASLQTTEAKHRARLALLNKLVVAIDGVKHHKEPSGKIVTAFKKIPGNEDYAFYYDTGNQAKYEQRTLRLWGKEVDYDNSIYISAYPETWNWDWLFANLLNISTGIEKSIEEIVNDLTLVDEYVEWDRIFRLSVIELKKAQPPASWYLSRMFGNFNIEDNPNTAPR